MANEPASPEGKLIVTPEDQKEINDIYELLDEYASEARECFLNHEHQAAITERVLLGEHPLEQMRISGEEKCHLHDERCRGKGEVLKLCNECIHDLADFMDMIAQKQKTRILITDGPTAEDLSEPFVRIGARRLQSERDDIEIVEIDRPQTWQ